MASKSRLSLVMRGAFLASVTMACCAASSQSPEETMRGLVDRMGLLGKGTVSLSGTERRDSRDTTVMVSAAFSGQDLTNPQLEVITTRDGRLTQRLVFDGQRVWDYSPIRNTYSSSSLTRSERLPADWRSRLFHTITGRATGASVFAVALLSDMFGPRFASAGRWQPWHRGSALTWEDMDLVYRVSSPLPALVSYNLMLDEEKTLHWTGARVESDREPHVEGYFKWQATIYPGKVPLDFNATFSPPKGSKPVSVDQPEER